VSLTNSPPQQPDEIGGASQCNLLRKKRNLTGCPEIMLVFRYYDG
jgi:hypothetical protein